MLPDLGPTPTQLRRIELSPTQPAPTPSRPGLNRAGSSARRTPLGTLSVTTPGSGTMTGEDDDGTPLAPRRLFRKGERPMVRPESPTQPGKAKKAVSAYDEMEAAQKREREKRERKEFKKHRFAAEQAEESDDEMAFGFGGKKSDEEEDSDEDDDGRDLEGLVETREIDEEELARELVQEKVAEQEAADDAKIDKRVRDIATGKERQKRRRGGLDLEDSDDEDADKEERDRMRRDKMRNKKRKIAGDTLEGLGKQDETKPFYNVYYDHLEDTETVIEPLPEDDEEMADDDDGEDGDEDKPGVVAMSDLQAKLREVARSGKAKAPLFNPYDVSKLDEEEGSDDEAPVNVRVVDAAPRAPLQRHTQGNDDDDDDFGYPRHRATQYADPSRHERDRKWVAEAGASGRASARSTASTSITGNKSRSKMAPPAAPRPKPVRKTESLLKGAMAQRKPALTRTGS
ncbi:hypothetical protein PENSPDRAFT_129456 [Peniophora sp. CONT]|nr:hypothetical protein PENSPDRAFT_129456 [Peniophora sp. CONT]